MNLNNDNIFILAKKKSGINIYIFPTVNKNVLIVISILKLRKKIKKLCCNVSKKKLNKEKIIF